MNKQEYIEEVLWQIEGRAYLNEIKTELEDHIEDRKEYYTNAGYDSETAEEKAVAHMGDAEDIGEEMNMLYNYKKHNIIGIIGLCLQFLYIPVQLYMSLINSLVMISNIIPLILLCIIYRSALRARGRLVMLFQAFIAFGLAIYLFLQDFISIFDAPLFLQTATLFIHGIICLTCTAELHSAIKGKPNTALLKRYRIWEKILYVLTAISAIYAITGFTGI
ncbi:MAG: permease prefix domain 1-containing protein [Eubacterium sp.]|nr:permease prefix domain 1-containing protein [Eubacterium sp.]